MPTDEKKKKKSSRAVASAGKGKMAERGDEVAFMRVVSMGRKCSRMDAPEGLSVLFEAVGPACVASALDFDDDDRGPSGLAPCEEWLKGKGGEQDLRTLFRWFCTALTEHAAVGAPCAMLAFVPTRGRENLIFAAGRGHRSLLLPELRIAFEVFQRVGSSSDLATEARRRVSAASRALNVNEAAYHSQYAEAVPPLGFSALQRARLPVERLGELVGGVAGAISFVATQVEARRGHAAVSTLVAPDGSTLNEKGGGAVAHATTLLVGPGAVDEGGGNSLSLLADHRKKRERALRKVRKAYELNNHKFKPATFKERPPPSSSASAASADAGEKDRVEAVIEAATEALRKSEEEKKEERKKKRAARPGASRKRKTGSRPPVSLVDANSAILLETERERKKKKKKRGAAGLARSKQ